MSMWAADVWDAAQQGETAVLIELLGSRRTAGFSAEFVALTVHRALKVAIANDCAPCVCAMVRALPRGASLFVQMKRHGYPTPLELAASCGSLQTVNALLAGRPALSLAAPSSSLRLAAQDGHADVVQALLDAKAAIRPDTLPAAAAGGDARTVRILLHAKASANKRDGLGGPTPLLAAVMHGCTADVVDELLRANADPDDSRPALTRKRDDMPLHLAASHCKVPAVRVLLVAKATVTAVNCVGHTPLHVAALNSDPAMCKLLVAFKADVRASAGEGTPLHTAAAWVNAPCAAALLELGADLEARDRDGRTPLQVAQRRAPYGDMLSARRVQTVRVLVAAKANVRAEGTDAAQPARPP